MSASILASGFREEPYWWEAFRPQAIIAPSLPLQADVVIVGGGYAGLSAARALADAGIPSTVLEAGDFGTGASTRSGGGVSAGLSVGKSFTGKALAYPPELVREVVGSAITAYNALRALIAAEDIDCHFEERGRFLGACAASHYADLQARHTKLVGGGATGCRLITKDEQRAEIGSDYYHGGLVFETAGKLHPALFYGGLLAAVRRRNSITLAGQCRAIRASRAAFASAAERIVWITSSILATAIARPTRTWARSRARTCCCFCPGAGRRWRCPIFSPMPSAIAFPSSRSAPTRIRP